MTLPGTDVESRVGLFPGQGGYRRGVLHATWASGDASVHEVFDAVDGAAADVLRKDVSTRIFGGGSPTPEDLFVEDPELLQLAIFGVSVSVYRLLRAQGAAFTVLMGHSLGEIGALVCAGAFSVRDGAELICHRIAATSRVGGAAGGLTSLACDPQRASLLLDLVDRPDVVIAVVNGPNQVVVAGPTAGLRVVEAVAAAIGINAVRLLAPAPFHSPLMTAVRNEIVRRLPAYERRPLEVPVYSPILGRFYREADDLVELLGLHLVTPVQFGPALARLHAAGARTFVEVGAGGTLTGLARASFPDVTVRAPLTGIDEAAALDDAAAYLRDPGPRSTPPSTLPMPTTTSATGSTSSTSSTPSTVAAAGSATTSASGASGTTGGNDDVAAEVRRIYAAALEYPEDVLTDDAHLEADLGIDSVKRTELLALLNDRFDLGPPPGDFRAADYETFGSVVRLMRESANGGRLVAR